MDEDSTTMAKKITMPHEVIKVGGINHAKKTIGNYLYAYRKSITSFQVISYLQKCFSYTIKQYKNDLAPTKASIQNIVPHCFGDHKNVIKSGIVENLMQVISTNNCCMEELYVGRN